MRNGLLVILALALAVFMWLTVAHKNRADIAELALARAEAKQATGSCGDQFIATVDNDGSLETYVAGMRVLPGGVSQFFQETMDNGNTVVFRKDSSREGGRVMVMVRPPKR